MSDGGGGTTRRLSCCLDTEFTLDPGKTDVVCLDLEGKWSLDSKVGIHPSFENKNLELVKGEVGDGGDNLNVTFKNVGDETVTIGEKEVLITVTEEEKTSNNDSKPESNISDVNSTSNQKPAESDKVDNPEVGENQSEDKSSDNVKETESDPSDGNSTSKKDDKNDEPVPSDKVDSTTDKAAAEASTSLPPFRDETQSTPEKESLNTNDNQEEDQISTQYPLKMTL